MTTKTVLISGSPVRVASLAKLFAAAGVEQVTLPRLGSATTAVDYYIQLGVQVPARGDTIVQRVQSFLNDGLLERFAIAERVLPKLAADAVVLLVAGNQATELTAPDDRAARLSLLRVLAHAIRADLAPGRVRVRVITSERTDEEIARFALTGAKDPDAAVGQHNNDAVSPDESYTDWRIQMMGLAQVEM